MPKQTFLNLPETKRKRIINASIDEFAIHDYEHINIQNIIKHAQISRGSFYQYFNDLDDLYNHLIDVIAKQKTAYLNHYQLLNSEQPFFDRIEQLYQRSYQFAVKHTNFHLASKHILDHAKAINHPLFVNNKKWLYTYYKAEIEKDIANGLLKKDIDIDMVIHLLTLFIDELSTTHFIEQKLSNNEVAHRFKRFITLLKKGISTHV